VRSLEPLVGLLSNLEVLRILHERGAYGQLLGSAALPSERVVSFPWCLWDCAVVRFVPVVVVVGTGRTCHQSLIL